MAIIPGKWGVFSRDSGVTVVQSKHDGTDYMVARCYGDDGGDVVSTASLIAAAPDLYAVCKRLFQGWGDVLEEMDEVAFSDLRMALMKAEGET